MRQEIAGGVGECGVRKPTHGTTRGREAAPPEGCTKGGTSADGAAGCTGDSRTKCVNGGQGRVGGGERPLELQRRRKRREGGEEEEEDEEEEEEEEEDEDEAEEEEERSVWAILEDADSAEFEAGRDNDGFLEDFAKELDGVSSCGEEEGGEERVEGVERAREEDDEKLACALQVRVTQPKTRL